MSAESLILSPLRACTHQRVSSRPAENGGCYVTFKGRSSIAMQDQPRSLEPAAGNAKMSSVLVEFTVWWGGYHAGGHIIYHPE